MDFCDELRRAFMLYNINLTEKQVMQFEAYYSALVEWNEKVNLTAITDPVQVIYKHFLDSLSIVRDYDFNSKKSISMIDVGSGAGFPGLPIKIVFPNTNVILLDSLNKRVLFLEEMIDTLNLTGIGTLHGRAEELGKNPAFREQFDLCVSRAVARLNTLCEFCLPLVKLRGTFVSYKSVKAYEEIEEADKAMVILGGRLTKIDDFCLDGEENNRTLICISKVSYTPGKYPRGGDKTLRRPI